MDVVIMTFSILLTIVAYIIGKWVYIRTGISLLLPIFTAVVVVIVSLILLDLSYEAYMSGAKWIDHLLGTAVVSLSYPLYQNRHIIKDIALPITIGTFLGAVIGLTSGVYLAKLLDVEDVIIYSLVPKSVTTPVAMEVAEGLGGLGSIAAVFVMIAGIGGVMLSPYVFRLLRITTPIGRGLGLGSASHAIGTSKALEYSELDASISTVAMILSAIFVSVLTPLFIIIL